METVNNIASAASKAIWGDSTKDMADNETQGTEPISGQTGDVSAGEPYDKGNEEPVNTTSSTTDSKTSELPTYLNYKNPNSDSKSEDAPPTDPSSTMAETSSSDKPSTSNENSGAGSIPSASADPAGGVQPTTEQREADKPGADETEKVEESKDEADNGATKLDTSTGPKETTKEAYNAAKVDTFVTDGGPHITDEKSDGRVGPDVPKGAMGRGEQDGDINEPSHGEGTGEKYIKSSGVKADGGDFDASKAGAGKEADRLMEEKGIPHGTGSDTLKNDTSAGESRDSVDSAGKESGGKEKVSLKDKIKAKLHKH